MTFDNEIERIKQRKLQELMQQTVSKTSSEANGKPVTLTDETFQETVSKEPVMMVDFWASWCGPCQMVSPIIEQLAHEYSGRVAFGKLNVDENPMVSNAFEIQSIPALLIFKNGKPVDGVIGAVPKQFIESRIKPYIPAGPAVKT
jgi:thioredoxin 1